MEGGPTFRPGIIKGVPFVIGQALPAPGGLRNFVRAIHQRLSHHTRRPQRMKVYKTIAGETFAVSTKATLETDG